MTAVFERLKINVTENGIKPIGRKNFSGDIFNNKNFKIYIVKDKFKYLYIGKTNQTIGSKLRQGFNSYNNALNGKRKGGYGGYKWIAEYIKGKKELDLFVFDLGPSCSGNEAESIEAEIVFQIRTTYNRWPEYQNEIHFNNNNKKASKQATEILKKTEIKK